MQNNIDIRNPVLLVVGIIVVLILLLVLTNDREPAVIVAQEPSSVVVEQVVKVVGGISTYRMVDIEYRVVCWMRDSRRRDHGSIDCKTFTELGIDGTD